jgi:Xaa-Pro aminopeptidase
VEKLGVSEGLIFLPGAPTRSLEDSDQPLPFHQRRYFYYVTGSREPDQLVTYDIQHDELTLYVPKNSLHKVAWEGRTSTPGEVREKYDVDEAKHVTSLFTDLKQWPLHNDGQVYVLHSSQAPPDRLIPSQRVDSQKLQFAMDAARVVKDDHEIMLMKKANEITAAAHTAVLKNLLKFKNEAQVAGTFINTCVSSGADQSYGVLCASGPNGAVLDYVKNNEPFGDRQLMVLDGGAEWECYACDVTRTFPLSGKWPSKEAKEIYYLVQKMQDGAAERLAPGARFFDLHMRAHEIAVDGLLELGILHNGSREEILRAGTSAAFFPHGLGHFIGLEVHDVSDIPLGVPFNQPSADGMEGHCNTNASYHALYKPEMCKAPNHPDSGPLEPGMVVTLEPGMYVIRPSQSYCEIANKMQILLPRCIKHHLFAVPNALQIHQQGYPQEIPPCWWC